MATSSRSGSNRNSASETSSNWHRATWLYYTHGLTQREVAERLGISRSTVIRMLDEARSRGEVQITVIAMPGDCVKLSTDLEVKFGLQRAIVVPESPDDDAEKIALGVGAALGAYLSDLISDGMVIGTGWGRTLSAMTKNLTPNSLANVTVLSLLGGLTSNRELNVGDISWRMAERLGANCLMMPAPLLVDSPQTKQALIEKCGLGQLFDRARQMDIAVISCGETISGGTSLTEALIPKQDYANAIKAGAVADVMCHFLDAKGNTVETPVTGRIMSVAPEDIVQAREIVLACGGSKRAEAIRASLLRFKCHTLVTDETAAKALLQS